MPSKNKFDIILIHLFGRIHSYYINIIKELSDKYSIGILVMDCIDNSHRRKQLINKDTERLYLELYSKYGGYILNNSDKYTCDLLLLPQNSFNSHDLKVIDYNKIIFLALFGVGNYFFDEYKDLGGRKVWVYSKNIFNEIIKTNKNEKSIEEFEIIEFIPPYQDYPTLDFSNLSMDYIIAIPTHLFLKDKDKLIKVYRNMRKLLKSIPKNKKVYVKEHNVSDKGNSQVNPLYQKRSSSIFKYFILKINTGYIKKLWKKENWVYAIQNLRVLIARKYIEKRTIPLKSVSKYHNLNIEHFLPFVKEGVITGISTCILNAYYSRLPVYNCDEQVFNENSPNYNVIKNYYLPYCNARLEFDPSNFNIVKEPDPKYDMIQMITKELKSQSLI